MHVKINRDEPDFNQTSPRGDPTILKREAETDLLVMDGHTAVIGGIFQRNTGRNLERPPRKTVQPSTKRSSRRTHSAATCQ